METVNVDSACRICLCNIQNTYHVRIEDRVKSLGSITYLDIFTEFSGFSVIELEPHYFCTACAKSLIKTYELKLKCIETQNILEEWILNEEQEKKVQEENKLKEQNLVENNQDIEYIIEELEEEPSFETEPMDTKYSDLEILNDTPNKSLDKDHTSYECEFCPSYYRTKRGIQDHYRNMHNNKRTVECTHCQTKHFPLFLDEHMKHCNDYPSICQICGIIINRKYMLRHINTHELSNKEGIMVDKQYQCDICGVRTVAKAGLVKHMQVQHLQYRMRCEVCSTEFKTPSVLSSHIRKYHPEKKSPLKCKLCDFTTTDASVLRRHHFYHTGEKRHKCELCGHQFRAKDVLRDHMTTHSDERPFPCSACKSFFKTRKALGVHMKTHRAHEYECPVCQKSYLTNQQMRNHVKKSHPEYELPPPGTIFNKNWRIRKAREEMKEMAIKEGIDSALVESLIIVEPPSIESKMYFRTNYTDVDRVDVVKDEFL